MHGVAMAMFQKICVANINLIRTLPAILNDHGFVETQRLVFKSGPEDTSILFQHPDLPFAFCCFEERKDSPRTVSLVVPDTPEARAVFLDFIKAQFTLNEITRQIWKKTAWFPPPRHSQFYEGRFWSAKPIGATGMDLGILPSLFQLNDDLAVDNAPDLPAVANAARARGFAAETNDAISGLFTGGHGPNSKPKDNFATFEINHHAKDAMSEFSF